MKALILCGGFGKRMEPITLRIPKPLIPLVNRPIIDYVMAKIPMNVNQVIIHVCYMNDLIIDYVKSMDYNHEIRFISDNESPGTGGAIKKAKNLLDEPFFVLWSDVISSINLLELKRFHNERDSLLTLACFRTKDPTDFGNVKFDEYRKVVCYKEKPPPYETISHYVSGGIFFLEPEIFDYFPEKSQFKFEEEVLTPLPEIIDRMYAYLITDFCIDIGRPDRFLEATRLLLSRDHSILDDSLNRKEQFDKRKITVTKPVCLGLENSIEKGVEIGPNVVLGSNNLIKEGAKIKNSVIFDECVIGNSATIRDSIIDSRSQVKDSDTKRFDVISSRMSRSWL
jgi:mannose-1-phosphate guanylyltransferase